jgi:hypothetical protein
MTKALTNMMSAIYNLIAQKDSNFGLRLANHSRTLAIESKRDSSSMKTIAGVTIIYGINQVRSNIRVSFDLINMDSDLN